MIRKIGKCEWYTCGDCEHITNVFGDKTEEAMGGYFLEGQVVTTSTPACNQFKKGEEKKEEPKKKKAKKSKKDDNSR